MPIDALFQLGIVPVDLNTSQEEEHFRRPRRRAHAAPRCASIRSSSSNASRQRMPARLHPMQDQVCHSRTPA
ncbi:hypothetical protein [Xenophilus azovorans]|uniref:hypothetical protein n=1 Tax=Xenophilus sp. TaxID=1873499 RepID=UPI0012ED8F82